MTIRGVPLLALSFLGLVSAAPSRPARQVLPFLYDDYPKALAQARARKVPLFIEAMAPW